jgi:hypothetical protein
MWPELLLKEMEIIWNWSIQIDFWEENGKFYRVFVPQEEFFEKYTKALQDRKKFLGKLERARFLKRISSWILTTIFHEWDNWENVSFTKEMAEKELDELISPKERQFYNENYL